MSAVGISQLCPRCGYYFPVTSAQEAEIKRGWLAPEAICPGRHYLEEEWDEWVRSL